MTPRERKAIAYLAEHFGFGKDYDPIANKDQADDLVKRLKLHVEWGSTPFKRGLSGGIGWVIRKDVPQYGPFPYPIYIVTGVEENSVSRGAAIVEAACLAIDKDWEQE